MYIFLTMNGLRTSTIIVLSIITTLLFLTANFGLWVNKSILDRENFTRELTAIIQSEEVTDSIADEILNQLLVGSPFVRQLADSSVKPALSGFINSPALEPAISKLAEEVHISLTSEEPREIAINISGTSKFIKGVISTISSEGAVTSDLLDKIILVEKSGIPSIYNQSIFLIWAGSIGAFIGMALLIYMILVAKEQNKGTVLKIFGAVLTVGTILTLISISNFTPTIAASR